MSVKGELVTIRCLPDGCPPYGRLTAQTDNRLVVEPDVAEPAFVAGALVEVQTDESLHLGEVAGCQDGSSIFVSVELFVDRAALAEIEKAWKIRPDD